MKNGNKMTVIIFYMFLLIVVAYSLTRNKGKEGCERKISQNFQQLSGHKLLLLYSVGGKKNCNRRKRIIVFYRTKKNQGDKKLQKNLKNFILGMIKKNKCCRKEMRLQHTMREHLYRQQQMTSNNTSWVCHLN